MHHLKDTSVTHTTNLKVQHTVPTTLNFYLLFSKMFEMNCTLKSIIQTHIFVILRKKSDIRFLGYLFSALTDHVIIIGQNMKRICSKEHCYPEGSQQLNKEKHKTLW